MTVELNWHEGEEQSGVVWDRAADPLPVATPTPVAIVQGAAGSTGPSRWQLLLLGATIGIVLGLLVLGALLLWQANQGNQLARQDVAAASALLLEAQAAGDVQRYTELLDGTDQVWKARLVAGLRSTNTAPPGQWVVERVRLQGDLAETEVAVTGDDSHTLRRLVFFRLADGQWRLAPPAPDAFGNEKQTTTPHFRVLYRERDQRFVPGLVNLAEGAYVALCGELRCTTGSRPLDLRLVYDAQAGAPLITPGIVAVASPSLTGWQPDGQPGAAFSQELVRQIAAQLALSKMPATSTALLAVIGDWAAAELAGGLSLVDETLARGLRAESLLPLDRIWDAVVHGNSDDQLFWGGIASVLRFVQSTWGSDAIGLLLEHAYGSLDDMTRRAFQVDSQTFEQMWLAWLLQQPAPVPGSSTG
jgi:hypothetical protein